MSTLFLKKVDTFIGSFLILLFPTAQKVTLPLSSCPRFLFVRPGGIGDAVLLVPAIQLIKSVYPNSSIEILAESRNGAIFRLCPVVESVYMYDSPRELLACCTKKYDVIIDTEQWHKISAVMTRFIRSRFKIGFLGNERRKMFSDTITYSQDEYEVDSFLHLVEPLDIKLSFNIKRPYLTIPLNDKQTVQQLLGSFLSKTFVVIFPGASIEEKRWATSKFSKLIQLLNKENIYVVVIGSKADTALGFEILKGNSGLNLAGKTSLCESAAVIDYCHALISGDSGILHIGAGLDKPTVSLFGSSNAQKWAPQGQNHIVINKRLSCSPCAKYGYTPKCPYDTECIKNISVAEVFNATIQLLNVAVQN